MGRRAGTDVSACAPNAPQHSSKTAQPAGRAHLSRHSATSCCLWPGRHPPTPRACLFRLMSCQTYVIDLPPDMGAHALNVNMICSTGLNQHNKTALRKDTHSREGVSRVHIGKKVQMTGRLLVAHSLCAHRYDCTSITGGNARAQAHAGDGVGTEYQGVVVPGSAVHPGHVEVLRQEARRHHAQRLLHPSCPQSPRPSEHSCGDARGRWGGVPK